MNFPSKEPNRFPESRLGIQKQGFGQARGWLADLDIGLFYGGARILDRGRRIRNLTLSVSQCSTIGSLVDTHAVFLYLAIAVLDD